MRPETPSRLPTDDPFGITRRKILVTGGATLAVTLFADSPTQAQTPGAATRNGGTKPVYVPQGNDPVSFSVAHNLFWNDILMEHATFFVMLMPGPELAKPRGRAEQFKGSFARQFEKARI